MNDKVPITNAIGASWNAAWNISVQVNINVTSFPLYVYNPYHPRPHLRFLRSTLASSEQILWSGPNSLFTCYVVGKSIT